MIHRLMMRDLSVLLTSACGADAQTVIRLWQHLVALSALLLAMVRWLSHQRLCDTALMQSQAWRLQGGESARFSQPASQHRFGFDWQPADQSLNIF